jgi:hypothetical protein
MVTIQRTLTTSARFAPVFIHFDADFKAVAHKTKPPPMVAL